MCVCLFHLNLVKYFIYSKPQACLMVSQTLQRMFVLVNKPQRESLGDCFDKNDLTLNIPLL